MKRAALYMRVSTVDQSDGSQLNDLEQMAQQRGLEIVQRYTDRVTGAKARRPGLDQLMADARRAQFDVVLVWASDRLARSVRHFLEVLDELNHLGIEFVMRSDDDMVSDPPLVLAGSVAGGCLRARTEWTGLGSPQIHSHLHVLLRKVVSPGCLVR